MQIYKKNILNKKSPFTFLSFSCNVNRLFEEKRTPALKEDVKLEVAVSATKWEPPQQEPRKPVSNTTADEEPMWIMDKLKAEHRSVKHSPVLDTKRPETNNNDVKQVKISIGCVIAGKKGYIYQFVKSPVYINTGLKYCSFVHE